jgi:Bifunctional DNA primase/polymerase, N-terminal
MLHESPHTADTYDAALGYWRLGLPIFPVRGKVPALTDWQRFERTTVSMCYWFGSRRCNVGLLTGAYIVLDADLDGGAAVRDWINRMDIDSPMKVRSGGGGTHYYFRSPASTEIRNRQGLHGIHGLDVRGRGGFIVLPPSIHPDTGERYAFLTDLLPVEALPRFRPEWYAEKRREPYGLRSIIPRPVVGRRDIEHVRQSIRRTWAIAGEGGHDATFAVSCELVEAGLSFDEVLAELEQWNVTNAVPLWSEKELIHKARSAFERVLGRRVS